MQTLPTDVSRRRIDVTNTVQFMDEFKRHVARVGLPVKIGVADHIKMSDEPCPDLGWCEDEMGRFVCVFNGKLVFQRYKGGRELLIGKIREDRASWSTFVDPADVEFLSEALDRITSSANKSI